MRLRKKLFTLLCIFYITGGLLSLFFLNDGKDNNTIVLLNTPEHGNLGDHLLARATHAFLQQYFSLQPVIEITGPTWEREKNNLTKSISEKDLLLISAGGFMGTLWPVEDRRVRDIISSFPNNKIIILPQSFYYHSNNAKSLALQHKLFFTRFKNVLIFVREYHSYNRLFPTIIADQERIHLYPDMALFLQQRPMLEEKRNQVILIFRTDIEKTTSMETVTEIQRYLNDSGQPYLVTETRVPRVVKIKDRDQELDHLIHTIAGGKLVITDRIHGMIFALIAGTPCIVFDNISQKVSGIYQQWIKECPFITCVEDQGISPDLIERYSSLSIHHWNNKHIQSEFKRMASHIRRFMKT